MQNREEDRGYFILHTLYFLSNDNTSLKWLDNIWLKLAEHLGLFQKLNMAAVPYFRKLYIYLTCFFVSGEINKQISI